MNFGHEWVDVYQLSLKFGAWSYRLAIRLGGANHHARHHDHDHNNEYE